MQRSYAKQLAGYIAKVIKDPRLNTSQLSLYMAMLTCWQAQQCTAQFKVTRKELMTLSKIASTSTYHICINRMIKLKYIIYEPTYDTYKGTRITLL